MRKTSERQRRGGRRKKARNLCHLCLCKTLKIYYNLTTNKDPYDVGDWILVQHGRWTRTFQVDEDDTGNYVDMRTVEAEGILAWQDEQPEETMFGAFAGAGDNQAHSPEDFGAN